MTEPVEPDVAARHAATDKHRVRDELVAELEAEQAALDRLLERLTPAQWELPTPAPGWTIRDQITHLAFFERAATQSVADPAGFAAEAATAAADADAYHDAAIADGRRLAVTEVLAGWRRATAAFRAAAASADPAIRCDWFVTRMSLPSLITARLMETWAHGQDVRDTVGAPPEVTDRLRHVALIGCNAIPYAFMVNGLPQPRWPIRVELDLPSGGRFEHGPADADDRVVGPVLDFCLLVTQRRHADDLELSVEGDVAAAWVPIAQAFAGPPGPGRTPGQFDR